MVGGLASRPVAVAEELPATVPPPSSSELRPEIQALRAIAVSIVVVYHFWGGALPGGFVGVDVFFAISGFLITSHLMREVDRTGAVSLPGFWARRARRILPAALMILLLTAIATIVFVPQNYWQQYFVEIRTSTAYIQNWHLAAAAVNYLAAANAASPVQHFWSLSAEEQFYIVWPVLILGAALATRRRVSRDRRAAIIIVLAIVTAASLTFSIRDTANNPAAAYFITPTRAWEFGLGGLLAMAGQSDRLTVSLRAVLSWLGLAAIAIAAITYSNNSPPFPGSAALLPILGAVAVIWAGAPARRWAPTGIMRLPPVQFLGNISYSVYLWHFPLLTLTPFVINQNLHVIAKIALILLTVLLAWGTKIVVEDPVRRSRFLNSRKPRWTFAFVLLGTGLVFAVTAFGQSYLNKQIHKEDRQAKAILATNPPCFGAAARDPQHTCSNPSLEFSVVPPPIVAAKAGNAPCTKVGMQGLVTVCAFGVHQKQAKRTFALVGDSHAAMWRAGMAVVAHALDWRGLTVARTSCPFSLATKDLAQPLLSQCVTWNQQVIQWFDQNPQVDIAVVSEHNGGSVIAPGQNNFDAEVAGYQKAWAALPATVKHIIVIRDTPHVRGNTGACVQLAINQHVQAGVKCEVPRSEALPPDPAAVAQAHLHSPRVQLVNITDQICDQNYCFPVVGGALVFKDIHHLSRVFATTLGPFVLRRIEKLERGWKPHR
jgi:peptidoglycan/LPS O-acetylase OafA/YrhL